MEASKPLWGGIRREAAFPAAESATQAASEGVSNGTERAVSSDPAPIRVAVGDGSDVDVVA